MWMSPYYHHRSDAVTWPPGAQTPWREHFYVSCSCFSISVLLKYGTFLIYMGCFGCSFINCWSDLSSTWRVFKQNPCSQLLLLTVCGNMRFIWKCLFQKVKKLDAFGVISGNTLASIIVNAKEVKIIGSVESSVINTLEEVYFQHSDTPHFVSFFFNVSILNTTCAPPSWALHTKMYLYHVDKKKLSGRLMCVKHKENFVHTRRLKWSPLFTSHTVCVCVSDPLL